MKLQNAAHKRSPKMQLQKEASKCNSQVQFTSAARSVIRKKAASAAKQEQPRASGLENESPHTTQPREGRNTAVHRLRGLENPGWPAGAGLQTRPGSGLGQGQRPASRTQRNPRLGVRWLARTQLRKKTVTRFGPSDQAPPRIILYSPSAGPCGLRSGDPS